MWLYSLRMFFKSLYRQKLMSVMCVGSLTLGFFVAFSLGWWAVNELSFENFHKDRDKIYRVYTQNGESQEAHSFYHVADMVAAQNADIETYCRVITYFDDIQVSISRQSSLYSEDKYCSRAVFYADTNFYNFFTFPLVAGEPSQVFSIPNGVVIDEATAEFFFPGKNPIGEILHIDVMSIGYSDFQVTGIMRNMPKNSHLQANIVLSLPDDRRMQTWGGVDIYETYFKLSESADIPLLNEQMTTILHEAMPNFGNFMGYGVEALNDIHFSSIGGFNDFQTSLFYLWLIILIGVVVALLVCVNFINMFISISFLRVTAISIQKVYGASRKALIWSFYMETFWFVVVSAIIGIVFAYASNFSVEVQVNEISTQATSLHDFPMDMTSLNTYLLILGLMVFFVLAAGTFPAYYMTRPSITIQKQRKGKSVSFIQKVLIITQFSSVFIFLVIFIYVLMQLVFMLSNSFDGYRIENTIMVKNCSNFGKDLKLFRQEMLHYPFMEGVTERHYSPLEFSEGWIIKDKQGEEFNVEICCVDPSYFETLDIKFLSGETFGEAHDSLCYCVINEELLKRIGDISDPLESTFIMDKYTRHPYTVKGVIRNVYTQHLKNTCIPQIYLPIRHRDKNVMLFTVRDGRIQEAIDLLRNKWKEAEGTPFVYSLLSEEYVNLYSGDLYISGILLLSAIVMLLISLIGLFSMAFYTTQRRIKEIGIRKVNGANTGQILYMLNKQFVKWIMIAFVISCPITYAFLRYWLSDYADHVAITMWPFIIVGIFVILVSMATVSWQTMRAARMNPVRALRAE